MNVDEFWDPTLSLDNSGFGIIEGDIGAIGQSSIYRQNIRKYEYVEVNGVKWGDILISGDQLDNCIWKNKGKNVKLYFSDGKSRFLIGVESLENGDIECMSADEIKRSELDDGYRIGYETARFTAGFAILFLAIASAGIAPFEILYLLILVFIFKFRLAKNYYYGPSIKAAKKFRKSYGPKIM